MKSGSKVIAIASSSWGSSSSTTWRLVPREVRRHRREDLHALPGTKALLSKVTEPTTLDLYFSSNAAGQFVEYKNYATACTRCCPVRARLAREGAPERDRPGARHREEKATAGDRAADDPNGSQFYFGLVATQADQQKVIPPDAPEGAVPGVRRLGARLRRRQTDKKKLGLITSLRSRVARDAGDGPAGTDGQYVVSEWRNLRIVPVEAPPRNCPRTWTSSRSSTPRT